MLLRSSSSPILNSWLPNSASGSGSGSCSSPESDSLPQLTRTRSFCLSMSSEDGIGRSARFDSDPKDPSKRSRLPAGPKTARFKERKELAAAKERERAPPQTLVVGGGCGCGGGGGLCGGGKGSDGGSGSQDPGSWPGRESTDMYYEMMIEANPGNALLLANYARFLKEVKHFLRLKIIF